MDDACYLSRLRLFANALEQDGELIAPKTRHRVARPNSAPQAATHFDEQFIARGWAQAVVDQLEAIHVQQQQREAIPFLLCGQLADHRELLHEELAIRQPGQRIVHGGMQ